LYEVTLRRVDARPTAIVRATTTWHEWPHLWPRLLGEVWQCLRAGGVDSGCPNVMLYRDGSDHVDVEVGVELRRRCRLTGRVVSSVLPGGEVATTVHHGPYAGLASAHQAVADWCAANGRFATGTRWEVYGPHRDDVAQLSTEVNWLLAT
jgi:effector-binding domain-containing protein